MSSPCLLDNDVVLKLSAYNLEGEALSVLSPGGKKPAVLGACQFVVRKSLLRKKISYPERVSASLEALLGELGCLETTEHEIQIAADLEETAMKLGLALDVGEAQLIAILIERGYCALLTGDKRAIHAASCLDISTIDGRLVCFEQILHRFLYDISIEELRLKICSEPHVDVASNNCFGCRSYYTSKLTAADALDGLNSYISDLRTNSGKIIIMDDEDFLSLTS